MTGFRAFTSTGVFQIDGTTPNYQLTTTLVQPLLQTHINTVSAVTGQYGATYWYTKFTFFANNPFFAFVGDANIRVCPWKFSNNGAGTFTAEFIGAAQSNIRLFIFDQTAPSQSKAGLRVYNTSGVLIADAGNPFARVLDVISGAYLSGTGFDGTGTTNPGPNLQSKGYGVPIAIAGCFPAHYMFDSGDGDGETTMSGIAVNGGTVSWDFYTYNGKRGSHFIGFREATAYRFMVLDMTGII